MVKRLCIALSIILIIASLILVNAANVVFAANTLDLAGDSYILVEANSLKILEASNEHEKMPVASICKLMTSLITMEYIESGSISPDDMVTISEHAASIEGSQAFLDAGSKYKVEDLLKTLIIASANDSSVALAEHIAGSENNFVRLMNDRASELGMLDTIYENATGLNTMGQHSTAYDTALILREVNNHDLYHKYSSIWMDELVHPSGRSTELVNTNRLVKYYDKCVCGKTGFTDEAGYCLSCYATDGKLDLIAVTLKCDKANERFEDCVKLCNFGFANFRSEKVVDSTVTLGSVPVSRGREDRVSYHAARDYTSVVKVGESADITINVELCDIVAPIRSSDVVGRMTLIDQSGVILDEINLVAETSVDRARYSDVLDKMYDNWNVIG